MLWVFAVILVAMWLLGMTTSYSNNGFIHILLAMAIIVVLVRVIQGRRVNTLTDFETQACTREGE